MDVATTAFAPTTQYVYRPGSKQFQPMYRAYRYGPQGTHGVVGYRKTDPIKRTPVSNYVNQRGYQSVLFHVPRPQRVTPAPVPRGGNVLRVVEIEDAEAWDESVPVGLTGAQQTATLRKRKGGPTVYALGEKTTGQEPTTYQQDKMERLQV